VTSRFTEEISSPQPLNDLQKRRRKEKKDHLPTDCCRLLLLIVFLIRRVANAAHSTLNNLDMLEGTAHKSYRRILRKNTDQRGPADAIHRRKMQK